MSRPLLALCLCLFAASAFAGETGVTDDDAAATKPGKTTTVVATTQDGGDAPVTHPVAAAPAHVSTGHPSRRWHSLLPGMIR
jgi:hypothetical protein